MEEEEGSPSIKLGLGIDRKTSKVTPVRKHGKCVFTTTQLHELRLQTLIFKYIAGGIQVPVSLVLSIWKSVAFSVGVYQRYPSFGVSPQAFDYRNMVDPEPGRCRRTDGKKWRCSKDVIPYQKYCLQHMHRGCRRSRKPVETTSQTALPDLTSSGISIKLSKNSKNHSAPVCSQYMNQSSCNTSSSHETPDIAAIGSDNICSNRKYVTANASTSTITATKKTGENDSKRIKSEQYEEKPSVSDGTTINRSCKCVNKVTVAHNISPTVGFSPKSVLQVLGNSSSRVYKNKIEVEPGRGARKHAEVLQPVAVPTNGDSRPSGLTIANKATCPAPSTSLSISIPSHLPTTLDEKSMSSSSETTISDTTVTVFDNGKFS
ncbi:Growth-regulating factor 10 [Hibiscus syriacus]|uniref:Growth-regulating factor n=1 Tax=Hibiscus syriacus TaxID=106335 RepID=A0A6A2ZPJ9_HIBSY|nr:Growth-regulating factor 10 [Hibiscus syriacus]